MANKLQHDIMIFISEWTRENKIPILRSDIIKEMTSRGVKDFTVINSLRTLQEKRFIRKSTMRSNKTRYVQLKTVQSS